MLVRMCLYQLLLRLLHAAAVVACCCWRTFHGAGRSLAGEPGASASSSLPCLQDSYKTR
jgi:hypothetical protein